ncbi:MAG: hypothetical protein ABIY71_03535 [Flavobacteriales bacterium]
MSTDLYGIRVLAKERSTVTLKVFLVYYDWDHIPDSKDFFLMVLWDEADTRFGGGGPLGDAITVPQICDEKFRLAHADTYVERIEKIGSANYPITNKEELATFYYEREGRWENEDKLAQVDFKITVTDPKWIAHVEPGMSWGTTAYGL